MDLMRRELGTTEYGELKADRRDAGDPGVLEKTKSVIVKFLTKDITIALKDGLAPSGKALQLKSNDLPDPIRGGPQQPTGGGGDGDAFRSG